MNIENRQKLKNLLLHDESIRLFPYVDIRGNLSIGVGRDLKHHGISQPEALMMLENDIEFFSFKLPTLLPWFVQLSETRQIVLISMAFNLGLQGFLNFHQMLNALQNHDYDVAADEILASKAAEELPNRYQRFAHIMRTNIL